VDFFAGETDIGGRRLRVLFANARKIVADARYFTPLLRGIVFVGDATLGARFDFGCIGLRAIGGADDFMVRLFRFGKAS
jgi:hypothetical protein